jgi:4-amino-4-deoxy-L-arabinose transferase-like glycosyltransferase
MNRRISKRQIGLLTAIFATAVLVVVLPAGLARQIPAFLLLWIWPALTWALWLPGRSSERFVIAAGLVLLANGFWVLLVSILPGSVPSWLIMIGILIVAVTPLVMSMLSAGQDRLHQKESPGALILLSAVLLLALLLRLSNLGYKELQGDEGVIMARAAAVLTGDETELFIHQKGPAEILLPVGTWAMTGLIEDFWIRLPFTWAGLLAVLAIYWLARSWFSHRVGLIAALLFAIGGFGIAFSRIVQYQNLVILWGALALLTATRYRRTSKSLDLVLSAVFLSGGLLAHYDAILFAPAVVWILLGSEFDKGMINLRGWIAALITGLLMLAIFYIPYLLSPSFNSTLNYLVGIRLGLGSGEAQLGWGGGPAWQMSTFYNSTWYVLGLLLLGAVGLFKLARQKSQFAAVLYFAVPTLFYILLVRDPRTHVYVIFPGATILAGLGAIEIWDSVQRAGNRGIISFSIAISAIWLVISLLYPILMFVDVTPERQRNWATSRPLPTLYLTTWQVPPKFGLFGFPHQAGWRVAMDVIGQDGLPYASNEEEEITNWYMAQSPRTHCPDFQTFLVSADAQDSIPYNQKWLKETHLQNRILVNGQPSIEIFGRESVGTVEEIEAVGRGLWLGPADLLPTLPAGMQPVGVTVGESIRLAGFDLNSKEAFPGGNLVITLYWEALAPIEQNNQVFVHLFDGELYAQHDGAPECDINPTTRWEPGQIISDTHIVELPDDMPIGSIPLLVGMYDLLSGERLTIKGADDNALYLSDVVIGER